MNSASFLSSGLLGIYNSFMASLPPSIRNFVNLFLLMLLIFLYAFLVWKGYRFLSKKDLLELDLNQYNKSTRPFFIKLLAFLFYFLEYIIISPIVIFIAFVIFTLFLVFLNKGLEPSLILLVSAAIIGAVRISSYYNEDLSRELAKFLPLTLLAASILHPDSFDFQRVFTMFQEMPNFFSNALHYLVFIVAIEILLRFFEFLISLFGLESIPRIKENIKKEVEEE